MEQSEIELDKIKCNDGVMQLHIETQETVGSGTGKHIVYKIKGRDSLGEIDIARRYREFHMFRDILFSRYPGLVIPAIPPKQATGNTTDIFVEERMYFLDVFLRKLSAMPYLASTPEVQLFLRPEGGKVEIAFKSMGATTTDHVLRYYRQTLRI